MEKRFTISDHFNYVCPECEVMLNTHEKFWQHLNRRHYYGKKNAGDFKFKKISNKLYECEICQKHLLIVHTNNLNLLQLHYFTHFQGKIYNCVHCNFTASRQTEMYEHLKSKHEKFVMPNRQLTSNECTLDLHEAESNDEFYLRYQCPQCGIILNKYNDWLQHINDSHKTTSTHLNIKPIGTSKPNYYYCIECKRLLNVKEDSFTLQKHRFTHLPYASYMHCAYCAVEKPTKAEIFQHFLLAHPGKYAAARHLIKQPIEWGQTNKITKLEKTNDDDKNKKENGKKKNYTCGEMDMDDSKNSDFSYLNDEKNNILGLKSHMHYICPECGVEFEEQLNWRMHIDTTHKFVISSHFMKISAQNAYKCLQCFQLMNTTKEEDLQQHHCSHLPYRAYLKCIHCNSCKSSKNYMLKHIKEYHHVQYQNMLKIVKQYPDKIYIFPEPLNIGEINKHLKEARKRIDALQ